MSNLYSINGNEPEEMPDRIRFLDGSTKTDKSTFTQEDLEKSNITGPYVEPVVKEYQNIIWDSENLEYKVFDTPNEYLFSLIRNNRNMLLSETDWTQFNDSPLSADKIEEYKVYRQKLRDFPTTITNPKEQEIIWPTPPEKRS